MAKLRIKRLSRPVGSLRSIAIYINGVCMDRVGNGEEKLFDLPAGNYSVYVKGYIQSNILEVNLNENDNVGLIFSSKDSESSQQLGVLVVIFLPILILQISKYLALFVFICSITYIVYSAITGKLFVPLFLRFESLK